MKYESMGMYSAACGISARAAAKPQPSILETLSASTDYSVVLTVHNRGTIPAAARALIFVFGIAVNFSAFP
jgi:hypothetical protein